jgi:hypothetical protein
VIRFSEPAAPFFHQASPAAVKPAAASPLLVRMHPLVRRDRAGFGQFDHAYRWRIASPFGKPESDKDMLSDPQPGGWGL